MIFPNLDSYRALDGESATSLFFAMTLNRLGTQDAAKTGELEHRAQVGDA